MKNNPYMAFETHFTLLFTTVRLYKVSSHQLLLLCFLPLCTRPACIQVMSDQLSITFRFDSKTFLILMWSYLLLDDSQKLTVDTDFNFVHKNCIQVMSQQGFLSWHNFIKTNRAALTISNSIFCNAYSILFFSIPFHWPFVKLPCMLFLSAERRYC